MEKGTPKVLATTEIQSESLRSEWPNKIILWMSVADYVLVKFLGGKINATQHKSACVVQNIENEVISLKTQN